MEVLRHLSLSRRRTPDGQGSASVAMVLAEVHISHSDLALARTICERPDVTIHREFQPVQTDSELLLFFSVEGVDLDGFDDALDGDPTVSNPRLVADYGSQRIYRVRIEESAKTVTPTLAELGYRFSTSEATEKGGSFNYNSPIKTRWSRFGSTVGTRAFRSGSKPSTSKPMGGDGRILA
ncbi:bacterio-opsin activator domain-containing protein [Haladaptatus sp. CMAA 1911]|uniref:bacterio-opsin activator domain-containing protein n=1 Tax=unclassified Haladaptatus TaxID=2622732 RepID=UPI00375469FA